MNLNHSKFLLTLTTVLLAGTCFSQRNDTARLKLFKYGEIHMGLSFPIGQFSYFSNNGSNPYSAYTGYCINARFAYPVKDWGLWVIVENRNNINSYNGSMHVEPQSSQYFQSHFVTNAFLGGIGLTTNSTHNNYFGVNFLAGELIFNNPKATYFTYYVGTPWISTSSQSNFNVIHKTLMDMVFGGGLEYKVLAGRGTFSINLDFYATPQANNLKVLYSQNGYYATTESYYLQIGFVNLTFGYGFKVGK